MITRAPNRPPRDIDAQRFFTEWLPREFSAEFGPGRRTATDMTVSVKLDGAGGGHWLLDVRDGVLIPRAADAPGAEPQVTLTQTAQDWRAAAVGEEGAADLAPPQASPLDVLFVDAASRQIMNTVKGTVRFEVTGFNGRTWWMQVRFGTGPAPVDPDAVLTVDAQTYAQILARKLAPPEAYFSGKVQLKGNTSLAMQLSIAMLPKFVR